MAGVLSGVLNGAVSLSGPPIVVLLANENKDKNQFRGSLTLVFFLLNIVTVALYWHRGLFQSSELGNMMILFPIMIIGTYLGIYLGNKVDEQKFKKAVLFLTFNRLDVVQKVFEQIKIAKPPTLYLASDGPRASKEADYIEFEEIK